MIQRTLALGMVLVLAGRISASDEEAIWQRIHAVRSAECELRILDENHRPAPSAKVTVTPLASGVRFGCNLFMWNRCGDPQLEQRYRARFRAAFDIATLPFYWWAYEPKRGETQAARIHEMAAWCHQNRITPKGHPLLWNLSEPDWLPGDPQACVQAALHRIHECVKHFTPQVTKGENPAPGTPPLIRMWDVVNEATNFERFSRQAPKLTRAWQEFGKVELVREAFTQARKAASGGTLLLNDYDTSAQYEQLIESLRQPDGKFPFDALGIQSHMHHGEWSNEKIRDVCSRFSRFGLPLHFTEVTILSGEHGWERPEPWPSTPKGEQRQAAELKRIYLELLLQPQVSAIIWWDLTDLKAWQGAPAGLLRADMTPKPAYDALLEIRRRLVRPPMHFEANAKGVCRVRLPHGTHRFTFQVGDESRNEYNEVRSMTTGLQVITLSPPRAPGDKAHFTPTPPKTR